MDENGMRFDEESVEELTRALYQVENVRYRVDHDEDPEDDQVDDDNVHDHSWDVGFGPKI